MELERDQKVVGVIAVMIAAAVLARKYLTPNEQKVGSLVAAGVALLVIK